jgi:sec-independent protein translocase protein TatC
MAPVSSLGARLYTFSPAEKFIAYMRLSVWTGIIVSLPFLLLQTGLFIWPALRVSERKYALAALTVVPVLFIAGAMMSYWFLSPVVMSFFLSFAASDSVQPLWGLGEYLALLAGIMVAAGLLLQTPLLLLLSFSLGITTPRQVARARPYIILVIFLLAGIFTPPDVISQIAMGVPLYLLFELSLLVGGLLSRKKPE